LFARLEVLDGTQITDTTRQFLRSWQANKDAIKQRLHNNSHLIGRQPPSEGKTSGPKWVPSHPNVDAQSLKNYAQKITK